MNPYISFVIAARNDEYAGNFLQRMQVFANVLLSLSEKHNLDAELVVVEWNPPEDRPRLEEAINWPKSLKPRTVRIIEVSNEIHRGLPNSHRLPMFEYIAKNVGIRRARGEYVLATNPDLLFSEELIACLASKNLSRSRFYRIDRYDLRGSIPIGVQAEAALELAKRHIHQVNIREDPRRGLCVRIGRVRRWYSLLSTKWPGSYQKPLRSRASKDLAISLNDDNGVYGGVYTNASGDFLLASSDSWRGIRGFPEFTDTFIHLDSYACHQLKAWGLEQALFVPPCMIMHAEHQRRERQSRPTVPGDKWQNDLRMLRDGLLAPAINEESWGLAGEELAEIVVPGVES